MKLVAKGGGWLSMPLHHRYSTMECLNLFISFSSLHHLKYPFHSQVCLTKILSNSLTMLPIQILRHCVLIQVEHRTRAWQNATALPPQCYFIFISFWARKTLVYIEYPWHNQPDIMKFLPHQSPDFKYPWFICL
jgi:hypothetical protein